MDCDKIEKTTHAQQADVPATAAKATVQPGYYRHFKGNYYQVLFTARHSETREEMVVYRALYGERGCWVRPAAMWSETVSRDDYTGPRFIPVETLPPEITP